MPWDTVTKVKPSYEPIRQRKHRPSQPGVIGMPAPHPGGGGLTPPPRPKTNRERVGKLRVTEPATKKRATRSQSNRRAIQQRLLRDILDRLSSGGGLTLGQGMHSPVNPYQVRRNMFAGSLYNPFRMGFGY